MGNRPVSAERAVTIRNVTGGTVSCDLDVTGPGIVSLSDGEVSLGADETTTVTVTLDAGTHRETGSGDHDGAVTVDCDGHEAVHAPWWVRIARAGN